MKNIFLILGLLICSFAQSQVKVLGYVVPNAVTDTYPTHLDIYGAGGLVSWNTIAERDGIPALRRKKGMLVYVADSVKTYQLDNNLTTWHEASFATVANVLKLASNTVLGGIKVGNDFTIGADSVMNISDARKNLWNQIALLPLYSTTVQVLSAISDSVNAHDYNFSSNFIVNGRNIDIAFPPPTGEPLWLASVAHSISSTDIGLWNSITDTSLHPTADSIRAWIARKSLRRDTLKVDNRDFYWNYVGGDSILRVKLTSLNGYTKPQTDSAIAANRIDTSNHNINDVIGINSNTLRFIKGTGYFDVIIQNGSYTSTQVDSAIAANLALKANKSTTLTINGITQDLSANRTWTIAGGVTSFNSRTGAIVPQLSDYSSYYAALSHSHLISDVTGLQTALNAKPDSVGLKSGNTTDTLINYYPNGVTLVKGIIDRQDGLRVVPYVTWNSGLTYDVTAGVYYIEGVRYTSPAGSITLNAAHSTLDRIDIIAVDNTGSVVSIQGTPSATPTEPQVDPTSQIYLTSVYIPAGSTVPQGVVSNSVYDEHVSPEWAVSAVGMTVDPDNTTAPQHGSKDASTGAWTNGQEVYFTGSSLIQSSSVDAFKIYVRLKSVMANTASISVRFFAGGTAVSNTISMSNYGLNKALLGAYQNITMPISAFTFTGSFNKIQIRFGGANSNGVYLDNAQFQTGTGTITNTNFVNNVYKKPGTDSVMISLNSKNVFAFKDSAGAGGTVTSVGLSMPGVVFNSSVTGSPVTSSGTLTPTLANQSAYTLFGRASGTGTPSFLASIDSNWIPSLHSENYYNTKYGSGGWGLSGNSINPALNFIGTTSNNSFRIRTNSVERMVVDSNGRVGIGVQPGTYQLNVNGTAKILNQLDIGAGWLQFNSTSSTQPGIIGIWSKPTNGSSLTFLNDNQASRASFDFQNTYGGTTVRPFTSDAAIMRIANGFGEPNSQSGYNATTLEITPIYNNVTVPNASIFRGIYYKPTVTSLAAGTSHRAIETVTGDVVLNTTSGNTGIGTATINSTAMLDVTSTSRGLLPPRMTSAQRDDIPRRLVSITITGAGSGYASAPVISFTGGGGSGATAISGIAGGVVSFISLTAEGTGYTSAPTVVITGSNTTPATATAVLKTLPAALTIYCTDCTATDGSTGVMQTFNGSSWKNNW